MRENTANEAIVISMILHRYQLHAAHKLIMCQIVLHLHGKA